MFGATGGGGLRIGRIAGISIILDFSWFIIAALITFSLGAQLSERFPYWGAGAIWSGAILTAFLFFASVLIHELAHSLVAKVRGLNVESIRLYILGGASNISGESRSAKEEFLVSVVGPLSSLVLGALFYGGALAAGPDSEIGIIAAYLGFTNLILGVFNLIPGFPLDGGRVLRAVVWAVTGSQTTATRVATTVGRLVGYGLIFLGVWLVFSTGNLWNGIMFGLIGWFLQSTASQTYAQTVISNTLRGHIVADAMRTQFDSIRPQATLLELVQEHFIGRGSRVVPVLDEARLVGAIAFYDVRNIPQQQWPFTQVGQVMAPLSTFVVLSPRDDLQTALQHIAQAHVDSAPVVENGQLVGIFGREEFARFMQVQQTFGGVPQNRTYQAAERPTTPV